MKKIVFLFILLFAATFGSMAQDYQEVVYLTDGSIIKGFIIEQVPDDYLKIETASGKIYTIEMYEVEKIIKERQRSRTQTNRRQNIDRYRYNSNNRYNDRYSSRNRSDYYDDEYDYDEYKNYSYFPNRGYKGFIDLGYSYGTESKIGSYSFSGEDRVEFSTSHGILINPYFFVGLGMGFHYYTGYHDGDDYYYYDDDNAVIEIPIFGHIRSHFIDKRVSPFADVKLGYSVYDVTGLYFSPSVGCRFAKGSRSAFWISLGYTVQQIDESYYNTSASSNAVSLKIGWDF